MRSITSKIFNEILKGEHFNHDSDYFEFYSRGVSGINIITLDNVEFLGSIVLDNFICDYEIDIKDCEFQNDVFFSQIDFKQSVFIRRNTFLGTVDFAGGRFESIYIYNNSFKSYLLFSGGRYERVEIVNAEVPLHITVYGGVFEFLAIDGDGIKSISVGNRATRVDRLRLGGSLKDANVNIGNMEVNELFLSGVYNQESHIQIGNLDLHSLIICRFRSSGEFRLDNIGVKKRKTGVSEVTIEGFQKIANVSDVEINQLVSSQSVDVQDPLYMLFIPATNKYYRDKIRLLFPEEEKIKESNLSFSSCDLGKAQFRNVALDGFKKLSIVDTDLSTIRTFNSTFPTKNIKGNHHSLYEIFNGLFTVAQKKNNKREQSEYYRVSKRSLLRSYLNKRWYKKIPSILSLSISGIFSNYGTRWTQSIFLVVPIISSLCFTIMMLGTSYDLDFSEEGKNGFCSLLVDWIKFTDPTHKINFMDGHNGFQYSDSLIFVVFDLLGRIFIAIGIFETILAFRKYVRK